MFLAGKKEEEKNSIGETGQEGHSDNTIRPIRLSFLSRLQQDAICVQVRSSLDNNGSLSVSV